MAQKAAPVKSTGYWLLKSEPSTWSFAEQVAKGKAGEEWTGVRNYQARNNMRAMKKGDLAFFYHSDDSKAIVGIARVLREVHPDSTDDTCAWECVDIEAVRALPKPVALPDVKAEPALAEMVLVKNSRLSVQPVTAAEWARVCRMGGLDAKTLK